MERCGYDFFNGLLGGAADYDGGQINRAGFLNTFILFPNHDPPDRKDNTIWRAKLRDAGTVEGFWP